MQHETREESRRAYLVPDVDMIPAQPGTLVEPAATRSASPILTEAPVQALDPPVQLVPLVPLTADVWNAEERYFAISGDTPELLIASAKANVPSDPSGADRQSMAYVGPTVWEHLPSYVEDPATGSCTMTGVTSTTRYQATVPRWEAPSSVPPELFAWWQVVLEHIRQHEGEHVRIFEQFVSNLPARAAGQPCGSWQGIVNAWSAEVANAQAAFDAVEAGWAFPPYHGPSAW